MEKALEHLGENYFYAEKIVENKFKLVKLGMVERASKILSFSILGALMMLFLLVIVSCFSFALIFTLTSYFGSLGLATLLVIILLAITAVIIYYFRKSIVYNPISKMVFKEFYQSND